LKQIKKLHRSSKKKDAEKLKEICLQNAEKFDDFDSDWVYFDHVLRELPFEYGIQDRETFLKRKKLIEGEDEIYEYFVSIKDFRLPGKESPLIFIKNNIKSIVFTKRKNRLINTLENSLYEDALNHNSIETFNTQKNEK